MLVCRIQSQVAVPLYLLPVGDLCINIMPAAGKYLGRITDSLLPERNVIRYIVREIYKGGAQGIVHLPVHIEVLLGDLQGNPVPLGMHAYQLHEILPAAHTDCIVIPVDYFQ